MKTAKLPSKEYLDECLDYDPDTGDFTWKVRPIHHFNTVRGMNRTNSQFSGCYAGQIHVTHAGKAYRKIKIQDRHYSAHRLAWIITYGSIDPYLEIDHIDGNGLNNAISNMRLVTGRENSINRRKRSNNISGVTGVSWNRRNKNWRVRISDGQREVSIGSFSSKADAIKARKDAEIKYGYHKNHGSDRPL